jgi:two-component system, cell cycle sensor histidine kinase and response regulator CckA
LRLKFLKSFQHSGIQRLMKDANGGIAPTVLLVEDDDQVRAFVRSLLTNHGYKVVEARTGAEGAKVAEEMNYKLDLLLTDMLLPELSGSDLAEQLLARRPGLKILFITGYVEGDIVQRCITELGASFLDKPFAPSVLLQRVRDAIGTAGVRA